MLNESSVNRKIRFKSAMPIISFTPVMFSFLCGTVFIPDICYIVLIKLVI